MQKKTISPFSSVKRLEARGTQLLIYPLECATSKIIYNLQINGMKRRISKQYRKMKTRLILLRLLAKYGRTDKEYNSTSKLCRRQDR